MARLKIKRNTQNSNAPSNTDLVRGELAFNESSESLFIGKGDNGSGAAASVVNLGGSGLFVDKSTNQTGIAGNKTFTGNITIDGNLTVSGDNETVLGNTVNIGDNIIVLNSDATGTPSADAGIEVERGDSANVSIRWDESSTKWQLTNDGSSFADIGSSSTDTNTTYSTSWVDSSNDVILRLTASGSGSGNDDLKIVAGNNITLTPNGDNLEIVATDTNTVYTHPNHSGDVTSTGDGATSIGDGKVTYAKMQDVSATNKVLGRISSGAGDVEELTAANIRTIINVEDGATGDQSATDIHNLLASSNLTADHLAVNSVGASELADNAVDTNAIADDAVTYGKMQDTTASDILLGRDSAGGGTIEEISATNARTLLGLNDNTVSLGCNTTGFATHVKITDHTNTDENNLIAFVEDAAGAGDTRGLETDSAFHYNPSTGLLTVGAIDGGTY
jgi:hypothetical protein